MKIEETPNIARAARPLAVQIPVAFPRLAWALGLCKAPSITRIFGRTYICVHVHSYLHIHIDVSVRV